MSIFDSKTDTEKELEAYENSKNSTTEESIPSESTINSSSQANYSKESAQKESGKFNFKSVLFLLWLIGSIVGAVFSSKENSGITLMCLGNIFLVLGGIVCLKGKFTLDKAWILIFPIVGLGIMIGGAVMEFGSANLLVNFQKLLPVLFASLFVIIGVGLIVFTLLRSKSKSERCSVKVTAVVKDMLKNYSHRDGHSSITYCPVYEFYYSGEYLEGCTNEYRNFDLPQVGQEVEIYVNPDEPKEIFIPSKKSLGFSVVIGAIFAIMGIISIVLYLSK